MTWTFDATFTEDEHEETRKRVAESNARFAELQRHTKAKRQERIDDGWICAERINYGLLVAEVWVKPIAEALERDDE